MSPGRMRESASTGWSAARLTWELWWVTGLVVIFFLASASVWLAPQQSSVAA